MKGVRSLCNGIASLLLVATPLTVSSSVVVNTATILAFTASPHCLEYRVTGICYWLDCTPFGCNVRTSVRVRHYVPDAVVSSYSNTGENPWVEVAWMSPPAPSATGGGDGTTNDDHENNMAKFRNADVIGHPGGAIFNQFASQFGDICEGAGSAYTPYMLSQFNTIAWRHNIPEFAFPEALIPGLREVRSPITLNKWGNVYPRGGFLHQADDHKAAAVVAQRAGDIVTRPLQLHVYQPLLAEPGLGYWPAGPLWEGNPFTGKWQELTPLPTNTCAVFAHDFPLTQAQRGGYAWALWRPYSCCRQEGQVFLGAFDFTPDPQP